MQTRLFLHVRLFIAMYLIALCIVPQTYVLAQTTTDPVPEPTQAPTPQALSSFNEKKYQYKRSLIISRPTLATIAPDGSTIPVTQTLPSRISFVLPAAVYQDIGAKQAVAVFGGSDGEVKQSQPLSYTFDEKKQTSKYVIPEDAYRSGSTISFVFPLRQFMGSATYKKGLVPVGSDLVIASDLTHFSGTIAISYTSLYQGREFTYWQPLASQLPLWINRDYFGINRTITSYDLQKLFTNPSVRRDEEAIPYIRVTLTPDEHYVQDADQISFLARTRQPFEESPARASIIQSEEPSQAASERVYIFDTGEAPIRHNGLRLTIRDSIYAGTISIETSNALSNWTFRGRDILASSPNKDAQFEKYFTTYKPTTDRYIRLTIKSLKGSVRPTDAAELTTDPVIASFDLPKTNVPTFEQNIANEQHTQISTKIFYDPNRLYTNSLVGQTLIEGSITDTDRQSLSSAFIGPEERNLAYIELSDLASTNDSSGLITRGITQGLNQSASVFDAAEKNIIQYRETIILGLISLGILLGVGAVVRGDKAKTKRS